MTEKIGPLRLGSDTHKQFVASLVLKADSGWYVTLEPPSRSLDANARFHAMLGDIIASGYEHFGRQLTKLEWKALFVTEWMSETKQPSDIVPTLYGDSFTQIRSSTRKLSGKQIGEVMMIVERFCAEKGIVLKDDERGSA